MKILIRLPNWLGDVVMSTAFVQAVRQLYPEAAIHVIVKQELAGLPGFAGVTIHPFDRKSFKGLAGAYRFGKTFRKAKFDLFFNLPASLSSLVLAWATGARKRIGFKKEGGVFLLTDAFTQPKNVHRVDEYIFLLERFTGKQTTKPAPVINIYTDYPTPPDSVLINFNSEASSRRMPVDKAKQLLRSLVKAFPTTQFQMVGSPKEKPYVDSLIPADVEPLGKYPRFLNYAGKTNLLQLAAYMASSTVILTTDSGPAHLANATGQPTIVLFGAGDESNTAPYNRHNLHIIRAGKLSCEPCVRNECKLYGVPKCMELLDEARIIAALNLYLPHA